MGLVLPSAWVATRHRLGAAHATVGLCVESRFALFSVRKKVCSALSKLPLCLYKLTHSAASA